MQDLNYSVILQFYFVLIYFEYRNALPVCMYVYTYVSLAYGYQKRGSGALEW